MEKRGGKILSGLANQQRYLTEISYDLFFKNKNIGSLETGSFVIIRGQCTRYDRISLDITYP